jgi:carboxypeptidase C (cathepsin A)
MKCVLFLTLLVVAALAAPEEDLVPQLKGYYDFSNEFKMYSGYLTLQAEPLISAHYLFVTSKNAPTDDVVLWLNGGPGCSSLLGMATLTQVSCRSTALIS